MGQRWNMRRMGGQNVLPQAGADTKMKKEENISLFHAGGGQTRTQNWSMFGYTENVITFTSNPNTDPVIIKGIIFQLQGLAVAVNTPLEEWLCCLYGES